MTATRTRAGRARLRTPLVGATALSLLALVQPAAAEVSPPAADAPTFVHYPAPEGLARSAGEPTLGVNWKTGKVLYQAFTETLQVTFDDDRRPATAVWKDVSRPPTNLTSMDPILETDPVTGRTLVSQLAPPCSLAAYTDSDGEPTAAQPTGFAPSAACGVGSNFDHQTVHFGKSVGPNPLYGPDRVAWYCSQVIAEATCSVSRNGGITFEQGRPVYTFRGGTFVGVDDEFFHTPDNLIVGCSGLHGHLNTSPVDGTAYLPNFACNSSADLLTNRPSVVVSPDLGLTWTVRQIPDGTSPNFDSDPAVDADQDNRAYVAYENATSNVMVTTTTDRGLTFAKSIDLGASFGIRNATMPSVQAGSAGRAAVAFLGTPAEAPLHEGADPEPENQLLSFDPDGTDPRGGWHLYVSMTYDGGRTWSIIDLTPADPVQRGCIKWGFAQGTQPPSDACRDNKRNLLDFIDIAVERDGRVVVGWADGCVGTCVTQGHTRNTNLQYEMREPRDADLTEPQFDELYSQQAIGVITRQQCGRGLYAAFDTSPDGPLRSCARAGAGGREVPTASADEAGPEVFSRAGRLPATGASSWLAVLGGVLLVGAAGARRRARVTPVLRGR